MVNDEYPFPHKHTFFGGTPVNIREDVVMELRLQDNITVSGYSQRLGYLIGAKITPPIDVLIQIYKDDKTGKWQAFQDIKECRLPYIESVKAYLFGLPNSAVYSIIKFLQLSLKKNLISYHEPHKEPGDDNPEIAYIDPGDKKLRKVKADSADVFQLIEAAFLRFKIDKDEGHYFRSLRNSIHSHKTLEDQDALEAIRHISKLSHSITTFDEIPIMINCLRCRQQHFYKLPKQECYWGNNQSYQCLKWPGRLYYYRFNV